MPADNTHHIVAAAQRRAAQTRIRALAALRKMDQQGHPINYQALAQEAGVSRSWLYSQADIRAAITAHRQLITIPTRAATVPAGQRPTDASLKTRLDIAEHRIRTLNSENQQLRQALAHALADTRNRTR